MHYIGYIEVFLRIEYVIHFFDGMACKAFEANVKNVLVSGILGTFKAKRIYSLPKPYSCVPKAVTSDRADESQREEKMEPSLLQVRSMFWMLLHRVSCQRSGIATPVHMMRQDILRGPDLPEYAVQLLVYPKCSGGVQRGIASQRQGVAPWAFLPRSQGFSVSSVLVFIFKARQHFWSFLHCCICCSVILLIISCVVLVVGSVCFCCPSLCQFCSCCAPGHDCSVPLVMDVFIKPMNVTFADVSSPCCVYCSLMILLPCFVLVVLVCSCSLCAFLFLLPVFTWLFLADDRVVALEAPVCLGNPENKQGKTTEQEDRSQKTCTR